MSSTIPREPAVASAWRFNPTADVSRLTSWLFVAVIFTVLCLLGSASLVVHKNQLVPRRVFLAACFRVRMACCQVPLLPSTVTVGVDFAAIIGSGATRMAAAARLLLVGSVDD